MADVLPSCISLEGLLYLLYSGFQANKSHRKYCIDYFCGGRLKLTSKTFDNDHLYSMGLKSCE